MQFPSWVSSALPLLTVAAGTIVGYVNLERDVQDNASAIVNVSTAQTAKWTEHGEYHREKALENGSNFARIDSRIGALEQVPPKVDQIGYRVTVVEQQAVSTANAIKELQAAVATQGADLRIALEILRRIDERRGDQKGTPLRAERNGPPG